MPAPLAEEPRRDAEHDRPVSRLCPVARRAPVLKANSFAAVTIGVQKERGQTVASSGPYAVVRHPMYAFLLPLMVGTPLLLGSLWGLVGVLLMLPLLAARALGEETVLLDGLAGYREYAAKVRFRLVPGVW